MMSHNSKLFERVKVKVKLTLGNFLGGMVGFRVRIGCSSGNIEGFDSWLLTAGWLLMM